MNYWKGFWGHLRTVTTHKYNVFKLAVRCGIFWQGVTHDMSKFSPVEFKAGVKYFAGDHSPNNGERIAKGYSMSWMHHKGRNKHHYEFWNDYSLEPPHEIVPVKMPRKYLIEMFCDRVAAGKTYRKELYTDDYPLKYFEKGMHRREIHPETAKELYELLKMLADKGEKETLAYIRATNKSVNKSR